MNKIEKLVIKSKELDYFMNGDYCKTECQWGRKYKRVLERIGFYAKSIEANIGDDTSWKYIDDDINKILKIIDEGENNV